MSALRSLAVAAVFVLAEGRSGRETVTGASQAKPDAQYVSTEFCQYFIRLGEAAQNEFRDLKGKLAYEEDDQFRESKLKLPEASHCVVSESWLFMCTWKDRPVYKLNSDFAVLAKAIRACFPKYHVHEFEITESRYKYFNLVIPRGERGGPTELTLRLDRNEIWLGVSKEDPQ